MPQQSHVRGAGILAACLLGIWVVWGAGAEDTPGSKEARERMVEQDIARTGWARE
ncbi:MAG TPA: hypothetical protein PLB67_05220 [Candidatus Hydrogenedentes bacterium]|nr:hypothetical protein [Candidatus Hydrogenedentota bacterium]